MLRKILIGLGLFLGALVIIGFLLPAKVSFSKSISVNAPAHTVFVQVADMKNWQHWSPWYNQDPKMQIVYSNPTIGEGAWYSWTSEKMGNGKMTVTSYVPDEYLYSKMVFGGNAEAEASHAFKASGGKTEVTWSFYADYGMNPLMRYMSLLMDTFVGKDYEKGLANLKTYVEQNAGPVVGAR